MVKAPLEQKDHEIPEYYREGNLHHSQIASVATDDHYLTMAEAVNKSIPVLYV